MERTILCSVDQGTTSTRAFIFDKERKQPFMVSSKRSLKQIFPEPGWVEHQMPNDIGYSVTFSYC